MHSSRIDPLLLRSAALVLLAGSSSCGHTAATQAAPTALAPSDVDAAVAPKQRAPSARRLPTKVPEPPASAALGDVMGDHFLIASWARDAVIAGSLEALRGPLKALADYRYDDIRAGGWLSSIAQLQAAALLTSNAATLDVAAMGVSTMARVCGECHEKNHAGPMLPSPPEPPAWVAADTVDERMGRHMWAAELLWEGLTTPSDVSWKAGAERLMAAPEELDDVLLESFNHELREIKALGHSANEAGTLAERADVYGLLIATCADCHSHWIEDQDL